MIERPDDLAPETVNDEEEDEEAQTQSVAQDALDRKTAAQGLDETEKVKAGIGDEDDFEDVVDHMRQMDTSGVVDMSAFEGEESMDDLENRYGKGQAPDADFANDDS